MKIDVSIIIPFLNEKENIPFVTAKLNDFIMERNKVNFEIIFVDDGSTDNSTEEIKRQKIDFKYKIVKLSKNYGSHSALRAGIKNSEGKYTTFLYADMQDPPELIDQMYSEAESGKDTVWAVRKSVKSSITEAMFSKGYSKLMKKFVSKDYPEKGFDVVLFNEKVKDELNSSIEANSSIFLQILVMGFKQSTIEYDKKERKFGKSKWTLSKKIKLFIDSFLAFSYFPVRLVSLMGILMSFSGFMWALYVLFRALFLRDLNQGWPTLISLILIGFGMTNLSLGIIAEYLWRTLDAARNRKVFIIDEVFDGEEG